MASVFIFLYEMSSSGEDTIVWGVVMMYEAFRDPTIEAASRKRSEIQSAHSRHHLKHISSL